MAKKSTIVFIILVLISSIWLCESLRCRTQDGPSTEEVRTVIRTCMQRLNDENIRSGDSRKHKNTDNNNKNYNNDNDNDGDDDDNDDDDNDDDDGDENSEDDDYDNYKSNENNHYGRRKNNNNNNNNNYQKHVRHLHEYFHQAKMRNQIENTNFQWQNMGNNNSVINNRMNNSKNTDNNQSSCLINCFLSQMKMTNRDGLPDKHKVINVITKHVRDRELNEFYKDSIQECFHIIEITNLKEKCNFSRNLVSCLNDRARANCDDFDNSMIFN